MDGVGVGVVAGVAGAEVPELRGEVDGRGDIDEHPMSATTSTSCRTRPGRTWSASVTASACSALVQECACRLASSRLRPGHALVEVLAG